MQQLQTHNLQPIELPQLPDRPLISVLVPNYNYAKYIGETLDSALQQTYTNFEIIVCDDGSKDNSCEVIEGYLQKDSRIKLIRKQNGGVATALNTAYSHSQGEIICLLDADDIWMNNKLQKILEVFRLNPKCGFAIHNVIQIDGQGNFLKSTPMFRRLASGWMGQSALQNGGFVDNIPPASALSIRREVANYIFPLNEAFVRNADSLIFRFAPFITVIGSAPEVLSKFRLHGANTTSQTTVTADFLEKEQVTLARIHQEQKLFLQKNYGTAIADSLTDLHFSVAVCHDLYLLARFKHLSKLERRKIHQQLVTHPNFNNWSVAQQWLFRWGEYLPDNIFQKWFDLIYGQSRLKRLIKGLIDRKFALTYLSA
ncbi:putative glucosyltransferase [Tolypothrix tenuis PCC 7101]|uniref:Putative glucosyltransferase n=1 Tax=Tolypothrix tenuis PCC 7101 TaxID=231146 RepID=A0A1Z4N8Y3_9CYAN|nr:glycosyltransferase family 2 protein [Aulosira sp. FACHB-113]BAZ02150.1 putative glucosyltransferase [Tolypothrix tenuis PCC 7101]BAZ73929.1 putative glucosyltransferase [Aulosira laxa NIES-50]